MSIVKCGNWAIARANPLKQKNSASSAAAAQRNGVVMRYPDTNSQKTATPGRAWEIPTYAAKNWIRVSGSRCPNADVARNSGVMCSLNQLTPLSTQGGL